MQGQILVVEDEQTIRESLCWRLQQEGYAVLAAASLSEARAQWAGVDLIVLDLMLGPEDGLDLLRLVRQGSAVPVIILTARDDEADKVAGLELGADDYVTKPFSARELVARIRANLRKHRTSEQRARVRMGSVDIDWARAEAFRGDVRLFLTAREFELLRALYDNRTRVLSRDWLLAHVWGDDYDGDARVVDTTVKRLRKKLETDVVETVRGLGYRLASLDPVEPRR